ncbi:MAG TPA: hypothetical protein VEW07_11355 [Solirubrobacterales bacterium]|nr:hypothetical protein [Solirubrobacterales bacterium]
MSAEPRLDVALRRILALSPASSDYEPRVRAFMVAFIEELDPRPLNIRKLADCFECLQTEYLGAEARAGLELLADRLERYYRGWVSLEMAGSFEFQGKVERLEWNP